PARRGGGRPPGERLRQDLERRSLRAVLDAVLLGGAPSPDALLRQAPVAPALRRRLGPGAARPGRAYRPACPSRPAGPLPDLRIARLLRAPRAGRSRRGPQRRLRPGGAGPWPLPPGGTVEARLPERAPSAGDAPWTRPSRAALGQRDHRADLRVAGPRAALLRLDPLARLPGGARPLSRRSRRDPRGHAGGRRGLRGGRPACARRDGAMRTWRRLPGSGK